MPTIVRVICFGVHRGLYSANKRCGQTACSSASSHKPFLWEGLDGFKVLPKTGGMACLQVPTPFLHHSAPRVITGPGVRAWRQSLASFPALSIFLRLDIHLQPICMACRHYLVELCACSSFCIISVEAVLPESFGLICICASSLVPASCLWCPLPSVLRPGDVIWLRMAAALL